MAAASLAIAPVTAKDTTPTKWLVFLHGILGSGANWRTFARQIVADVTRNGGFPPLMIDPIDFAQMFTQRMAEEQARAKVQALNS